MDPADARSALEALIRERGEDYASLSRLLGRNDAYVQQYIRRGSPRRLADQDRRTLARYFGIAEAALGGPAVESPRIARAERGSRRGAVDLVLVPRLAVAASAGPGAWEVEETAGDARTFDAGWLREMAGGSPAHASMIRVTGESMAPTLLDGDDILVDRGDTALRDGVYVLRMDDALLVKRLRVHAEGIDVLSDNPAFESRPASDPVDLQIVGRVLWVGRRLR